jgi:hypothetical protein
MQNRSHINNRSAQSTKIPPQFCGSLETLADSLEFFGYTGQWLNSAVLVDILLDSDLEQIDADLEPDRLLDCLDALFAKSPNLQFGKWEAQCRGKNPKKEYIFSRRTTKPRKGTIVRNQ